ncbi:hypothetical protein BH11BAC5_BH11BAC5_40190 [soil metagenome]
MIRLSGLPKLWWANKSLPSSYQIVLLGFYGVACTIYFYASVKDSTRYAVEESDPDKKSGQATTMLMNEKMLVNK